MHVGRGALILVVTAFVQAAVWFGVLRLDPFGMSSAADRASEEIFLRLYPTVYESGARDAISVVLIDQDNLVARDRQNNQVWPGQSTTWPINFDEHIDLIKTILAARPKALFVDILYDTDIPDTDPLKKTGAAQFKEFFANLPPNSPPIVFASLSSPASPLIEPLKSLPTDPQRAKQFPTRIMQTSVEFFAEANHYPVFSPTGTPQGSAALYELTADAAPTKLRSHRPILRAANGEMLLVWGNTIKRSAQPAAANCAPIFDDARSRFSGFLSTITVGLLGKVLGERSYRGPGGWDQIQPCEFHEPYMAGELYTRNDAEKLRGKYVFLGITGDASSDTVVSPVHGQLPGVFQHAMALDNLLTFDGRFLHASPWIDVLQFLLIFAMLIGGGIMFRPDIRTPKSRTSAFRILAARAAVWLVFSLASTALLTAFLTQLFLAPYNWGGVVAISGIAFFTGAGKELRTLLFGPN